MRQAASGPERLTTVKQLPGGHPEIIYSTSDKQIYVGGEKTFGKIRDFHRLSHTLDGPLWNSSLSSIGAHFRGNYSLHISWSEVPWWLIGKMEVTTPVEEWWSGTGGGEGWEGSSSSSLLCKACLHCSCVCPTWYEDRVRTPKRAYFTAQQCKEIHERPIR